MDEIINALLHGEIFSLDFSRAGFWFVTEASCDCEYALIRLRNQREAILVSAKEDKLILKSVNSVDESNYSYRFVPQEPLRFAHLFVDEGKARYLKFRYGDGYLFLTACESWLIICLGQYDITGEENTDIPDYDDTELKLIKLG